MGGNPGRRLNGIAAGVCHSHSQLFGGRSIFAHNHLHFAGECVGDGHVRTGDAVPLLGRGGVAGVRQTEVVGAVAIVRDGFSVTRAPA